MTRVVTKVGGSLYDLPDLGDRLRTWLAAQEDPVLLVPGGGAGADVIRQLDRTHRLGEFVSHDLALRVLSVNAHLLARLVSAPVVAHPREATDYPVSVLDCHAFSAADEGQPGSIPHIWQATSDTVAARVATVWGATLALLKSTDRPGGMSWNDAAAAGLVDECLAGMVERTGLIVRWVNLRRPEEGRPAGS